MQDGFFIGLRSLGIGPTTKPLKEYPADQRPPIEGGIDQIISQVEAFTNLQVIRSNGIEGVGLHPIRINPLI